MVYDNTRNTLHKGAITMEIKRYGKKTWIAVLVLAVVSIVVDVLIMAGVLDAGESMESATTVSLVIALMGVYYSIRGILYHVKKDKEQE